MADGMATNGCTAKQNKTCAQITVRQIFYYHSCSQADLPTQNSEVWPTQHKI